MNPKLARERFAPAGVMAIAPMAYGAIYDQPQIQGPAPTDGAAVLHVRGPLMHHGDSYFFDSYESIIRRGAEAFASPAKAVVMCIDSPGGLLAGSFDAARKLREMAKTAGKPLHAFVEGQASSAAYALACAADKIWISESGQVGSIGIIDTIADVTAQDAQLGLRFTLVASGSRKTDGNPHVSTSDEAIAATQERVDDLGNLFFQLVSEFRGLGVNQIRGLEATILNGAKAVNAGLADQVATFDQMLAAVASEDQPAPAGQAKETTMNEDEKARKALQAIVDDEEATAKAKSRARRALKAMDEDEDEKAEGDDEKKDDEAKSKAKAESDDGDDEKKEDEAKSSSKAEGDDDEEEEKEGAKAQAPSVLSLARDLHAMRVERQQEKEAEERATLLASRQDFDPAIRKTLEKVSLKDLKEACETWPRGNAKPGTVRAAAAAASVPLTRGDTQGDHSASRLPEAEKLDLDMQMGLRQPAEAVRNEGTRQILGVMTRAQAAEFIRTKAAKAKELAQAR